MAFMGSFSKASIFFPLSLIQRSPSKNQIGVFRAHIRDDSDSLFHNAKDAALLRFIESHQPAPLFVDPYVGCFVSHNVQIKQYTYHYCVATKFIDDNLLQTVSHIDGLKQVVLLTDGMDTRPYRLRWPMSTIIFDISPNEVFRRATHELKGIGAKIPKGNFFYHIPLESPDIHHELCTKGYRGDRPSIWVMQGLPMKALIDFEDVLFNFSCLAMKGSFFLGELPSSLVEAEIRLKSTTSTTDWMDRFFLANGFRVEVINLEEVARTLGKELTLRPYKNIPFIAEQLRFSDDQMEFWRKEFNRIESEVDEEGFEDL